MTVKHQFVDQMASNKASPTGHENAFSILVRPELDLWITACLRKMAQLEISYIVYINILTDGVKTIHLWHP